jgi:integrase
VWLDPTTLERLHRHQRRAVLAHDWGHGGELEDTPVFTVGSGPVHPAYASRHFTTLCARAGVPVIRLHDLRHTSASLGLAAGEPLLHVSRRLGHSSIAVTADVYTQVTSEAAKTAAAALSTVITGT